MNFQDRLDTVFQPDPQVVSEQFDANNQKFDLVFSDGAAETRCLAANLAMERNVPKVVLHDAEKVWHYQWNLLSIPANYIRFNFWHFLTEIGPFDCAQDRV